MLIAHLFLLLNDIPVYSYTMFVYPPIKGHFCYFLKNNIFFMQCLKINAGIKNIANILLFPETKEIRKYASLWNI